MARAAGAHRGQLRGAGSQCRPAELVDRGRQPLTHLATAPRRVHPLSFSPWQLPLAHDRADATHGVEREVGTAAHPRCSRQQAWRHLRHRRTYRRHPGAGPGTTSPSAPSPTRIRLVSTRSSSAAPCTWVIGSRNATAYIRQHQESLAGLAGVAVQQRSDRGGEGRRTGHRPAWGGFAAKTSRTCWRRSSHAERQLFFGSLDPKHLTLPERALRKLPASQEAAPRRRLPRLGRHRPVGRSPRRRTAAARADTRVSRNEPPMPGAAQRGHACHP